MEKKKKTLEVCVLTSNIRTAISPPLSFSVLIGELPCQPARTHWSALTATSCNCWSDVDFPACSFIKSRLLDQLLMNRLLYTWAKCRSVSVELPNILACVYQHLACSSLVVVEYVDISPPFSLVPLCSTAQHPAALHCLSIKNEDNTVGRARSPKR